MATKTMLTLAAGADLIWILDPPDRSALVVTQDAERLLSEAGELPAPARLPGLSISAREALDA